MVVMFDCCTYMLYKKWDIFVASEENLILGGVCRHIDEYI